MALANVQQPGPAGNNVANGDGIETRDLFGTLKQDCWLKLPLAVVRDVGPAAQSLGGLLRVASKTTFVATEKIAEHAHLPIATVRKHLLLLEAGGWLDNAGRSHTKTGRPRRTCDRIITPKTIAELDNYSVLPWWACCAPGIPSRRRERRQAQKAPSWAARAVLAVVMARVLSIKATLDGMEGFEGDYWAGLEELGGPLRFRFSLSALARVTGLSRKSLTKAKGQLKGLGIIQWYFDKGPKGDSKADQLVPNPFFTIKLKASPTRANYVNLVGYGAG